MYLYIVWNIHLVLYSKILITLKHDLFLSISNKRYEKILIFKGRIVRLGRSQPFDVTLTLTKCVRILSLSKSPWEGKPSTDCL